MQQISIEQVQFHSYLKKLLVSKNTPQAVLLCGKNHEEMYSQAKQFAHRWLHHKTYAEASDTLNQQLLVDCIHLQPQGKLAQHSLESIRKMIVQIQTAPFIAKARVAIISHVDRMLPTSANALLKTLEEPPSNTLFLLLTTNVDKILPTIISRVQKITFSLNATVDWEGPNKEIYTAFLEIIAQGSFKNFIACIEFCKILQKHFEGLKKALENKTDSDDEKEHEAEQSLLYMTYVEQFLEFILLVYRELWFYVQLSNTQEKHLNFPEKRELFLEAIQRISPLALVEVVHSECQFAKQSLSRSGSLVQIFERLFVQLGLVG